MRRLPIRAASSAWPSALLILCAPVCVRSSRFRQNARAAARLLQPARLAERRRAADVVAQQPDELGLEGRVVRAPRGTRARAPRSGRPASRARSARRTRRSSRARRDRGGRTSSCSCVCSHGGHERRQSVGDPSRRASARRPTTRRRRTGAPREWPSATLSGVSPPARITGRVAATGAAATSPRSCPVPPRRTGSCASTSTAPRAGHRRGSACRPSRRATRLAAGASRAGSAGTVAVQLRHLDAGVACPRHVVRGRIDEHADRGHERRQRRHDRGARARPSSRAGSAARTRTRAHPRPAPPPRARRRGA